MNLWVITKKTQSQSTVTLLHLFLCLNAFCFLSSALSSRLFEVFIYFLDPSSLTICTSILKGSESTLTSVACIPMNLSRDATTDEFCKWIKGSIVNWNKHLPEYTYLTTHVVAFTLSAYTVSKVSWYYKKKRVEQIILLLYYCVFRCYKQTDLTNLTQSQKYTCIGSWYETNLENT